MARPKIYPDHAARQRAYRERKRVVDAARQARPSIPIPFQIERADGTRVLEIVRDGDGLRLNLFDDAGRLLRSLHVRT
jgi:hypothetical protein